MSSMADKDRLMQPNGNKEPLSESRRKEIFRALVDAQDHQIGVLESRARIAKQFSVDTGQLKRIEEEGIDNNWAPLEDPPELHFRS